jgi:hypothetical protein
VQLAEGVGPVQQLVIDQRHQPEGVSAAGSKEWTVSMKTAGKKLPLCTESTTNQPLLTKEATQNQ